LRRWLREHTVKHIAMESTGVYWVPVWNVLERGRFQLMLVNPAIVRALRGCKTDRIDARRIAESLHHGLLHGASCRRLRSGNCAISRARACCSAIGIGSSIASAGCWRPPTSGSARW
jgi:transposase